jgi:hypothetical protein
VAVGPRDIYQSGSDLTGLKAILLHLERPSDQIASGYRHGYVSLPPRIGLNRNVSSSRCMMCAVKLFFFHFFSGVGKPEYCEGCPQRYGSSDETEELPDSNH